MRDKLVEVFEPSVKVIIDDEDLVIKILETVSEEFQMLVVALSTQSKFTSNDVLNALLREEWRQLAVNGEISSDSTTAFIAGLYKKHGNKSRPRDLLVVTRFRCGRQGHMKKNCRSQKSRTNSGWAAIAADMNPGSTGNAIESA
ncbi:hypothetical protein RUND412_002742 [Rhizina undulata]